MEDKTPQTNALAFAELLIEGLRNAKEADGSLANATGKAEPMLAPQMQKVMPLNALAIALASDKAGYKTNIVMLYLEAKKEGIAVKGHSKGVPCNWFSAKEYQNVENADAKISRNDYLTLPAEEKAKYRPVTKREISYLFNVDQTTMAHIEDRQEEYADLVKNYGAPENEKDAQARDKATRIAFNNFIKGVKENLVPVRRDAEKMSDGKAVYDPKKDVIHLPPQSAFPSYADYVQEVNRLLITATGSQERLGRKGASPIASDGMANRERLIVELASAAKNLQLGLEAKLSKESLPLVDGWVAALEEKPDRIYSIEKDVNRSLAMLNAAANGKKFELKSDMLLKGIQKENEVKQDLIKNVDKFKFITVKDEKGKDVNVFYIKPEGRNGFAVVPEKQDVELFFASLKKVDAEKAETKVALANKYALAEDGTYKRVDIFNDSPKGKNRVSEAQVFKFKNGNYGISAVIDGQKHTRELTPSQTTVFFLSEDKKDYAKGLAVKLFPQFVFKTKKDAEAAMKTAQDKRVKQAEASKAKKAQADPKKKEQERKEAKQREEFRKSVLVPAIDAAVIAKANSNALQIISSQGSMVAVGDNAQKLSEALSIPVEEVKDGQGVSTKVAFFADKDLEKNLGTLKEIGIDVEVINPEEKGTEKVEVRQQTTETTEATETVTTQSTVDESTGEVMSQKEETDIEEENEDLDEEETEEETRSFGRGR